MAEKQDKPLLVDTGKGFSIKWRNRFLYSSRDPLNGILRRVESLELQPDTLYLIPSPLLGYGIREILMRLPSRSYILGVERFQELMALTQPLLPDTLTDNPGCSLIRTEDPLAAGEFVARLGLNRFKRCRRLDLTGGSRLDALFYKTLEEELNRRIFLYWQTRASLVKMGPLWFRNIFKNVPELAGGHDLSSLKIKGTLVLCGAGESLEESLPLLKKIRDNIFLCAVDTAYPVLTGSGLIPDAVFNLDGQFYNFYDYYRHGGNEIFLISDITAFPGSVRLPGIRPLFFSSRFAENALLTRMKKKGLIPTSIPPLGSVGVTALHLCSLISEGPFLLTGLDFSYIPGKSHARDTVFHQIYLSANKRTLPDGGMTGLSLKRPARSATGQLTGRRLRSDTVLEGYYRSFLDITSLHRGRCFQLALDYPSLGVPLIHKRDLADLTGKVGKPDVRLEKTRSHEDLCRNFLKEEVSFLERVIGAWEDYIGQEESNGLDDSLALCNYLTMTSGMKDECSDDIYYTGAVKNARSYLSYAKQALSRLARPDK